MLTLKKSVFEIRKKGLIEMSFVSSFKEATQENRGV
jgi:hypothetical protein